MALIMREVNLAVDVANLADAADAVCERADPVRTKYTRHAMFPI